MIKKDINFFSVYNNQKQSPVLNKMVLAVTFLIIFSVFAVLGIHILLMSKTTPIKNEIAGITSYINDPKLQSSVQYAAEHQQELALLKKYNEGVTLALGKFENIPKFTSQLLSVINNAKPEGVTIQAITFQDEKFTLACVAPEALSAPGFAQKLENAKEIAQVEYTGETATVADKKTVYMFTLKCSVKGGEVQ